MRSRSGKTSGHRTVAISVVVFVALVCSVGSVRAADSGSYPKIANIYFPTLIGADLERLAGYDMLVLASRAEEWYQDELATIRSLNPDIVLLVHIPVGYHGDYTAPQIEADVRVRLYGYDWWMYDTNGQRVVNAHGDGMMNITPNCPRNYNGDRLCDWLPKHIASWVGPGGQWDGVYLDYAMDDIHWLNAYLPAPMDSDGDCVADSAEDLNAAWREGLAIVVSKLREIVGDDYIIATNGNNTLYEYANGSTREDFPRMHGDWYDNIQSPAYGYVTNEREYGNPSANIINTIWRGPVSNGELVRTSDFEREIRFGLASTLVFGDGYYSFDGGAGLHDHSQTWWHELYEMDLGKPVGKALAARTATALAPYIEWGDMTRVRRFEKGVVAVNPTSVPLKVELESPYYPAESWNGEFYPFKEIVTSTSLAASSGGFFAGSGKVLAGIPEVSYFLRDNGSVQLSWNEVDGAVAYSVYRSPERGGQGESELLGVVETAGFSDASAARGSYCSYTVAPIDVCRCEGQPSRPVTVSTELGSGLSIAMAVFDLDGQLAFEIEIPDSLLFDLIRIDDRGDTVVIDQGACAVRGGYRASDPSALRGEPYVYEVVTHDGGTPRTRAQCRANLQETRRSSVLHGCSPNPVTEATRISFDIAGDDRWTDGVDVDLTVYDACGRVVRRVEAGTMSRGPNDIVWDGRSESGARVAAGGYFYALSVGDERLTGKMLVIR